MGRIIYIFVLSAIALALVSTSTYAQDAPKTAAASSVLQTESTAIQSSVKTDNRAVILASFLDKYDSPLATYSAIFIKAADTYKIDWRLVPAITGVESTFGKQIPYKSFNAYGWNNGDFKFESWEQSIWHVTKILREKYINRGLTAVPQIARVYAPPSDTWASKVINFMAKIEDVPVYSLDL